MASTDQNHSLTSHSDRVRELAALIHPGRFAGQLDGLLSAATVLQLQKTPRLQQRLVELLMGSELVSNGIAWGRDVLLGHDPRRAALLAGSIWHARSVLKLVSKPDVAILIENIGAEAHAFAVRHLSSAVATTSIDDPQKLASQIEHDGCACLGAWLKDAKELDRVRVLFRLPVGTTAESPAAEHHNSAGELLSLVVAHLATEEPAA
ncbi:MULTISPECIES: nodulation protein NolU [Bradyrhizobium]|uniref:Nodulation protein NolU n=1 Tax=Bradyrhizobium frederickii TaxID=2560054 RepID=A0A4Y9NM77_9BRAD|nr:MULTISPECIES: nodulation protein NolU [Bradyrhizobium]RTE88122.1 nodulation protein NolU [Bradyrhizobium sp. LVM 105]TFV29826.1 nodulation protein NolU [Bradyrhizobium frederickii]TFV68462.1 nodulation protein NolU [Bradyrhizobium frederickii]